MKRTMRLSMAQMRLGADRQANEEKTLDFARRAAGSDLLFFPEIQNAPFFPQYPQQDVEQYVTHLGNAIVGKLQQLAREQHMAISPNFYIEAEDGRRFDRSLWLDADGELIGHASMDVLHGSDVAYYVVKRSSAITVAAQLTDNWIEFPTLDKYSESSKAWNGLTAVTYEALIYLDDFATSNATGSPVNISSIMGVEQYLLLRIGDTNFERQQLQFDGSGAGSSFGKIPGRDATKNLEKGRWYHVACTYDQAARTARIYVDGQIQSEATDVGISAQSKKNQINLAMRALYDLWNTAPDNEKPQYETDDTGYNKLGEAYQFFLGRSYDDYRPLNGKIAEARVWSVARTPEQIWDNMYDIQNPQDDPTLLGYWKCNDASGNTVKDYSMYRNDGVAKYDIIWPQGIEIPKLNENNE
jgi:hypothetical protein